MPLTIIGRKPVIEALKAGTALETITLLEGIGGKPIEEIRRLAKERNVPLREVNRDTFRELARDRMTQGVVATLRQQQQLVSLEAILAVARQRKEEPFVLILDEIVDPHNVGALVRTAECAGVHGVVIPKHHAAPITATVVKASAGATEHLAIAEVTNIVATIERLKKENLWIVGLDGQGDKLFDRVDYTPPIALVVGNEAKGIRRLVKEHCDFLVRIPLFGKIESLNASVAGAVAMYEVVRQRTRG